ncbi:T9SS type A sorting domain-containing protein [Rhodoflexus sp.]
MYNITYQQFVLALSLFFIVLGASAQTSTWTGASSTDWNTAANWTGGVPTASSTVIINACTTCPVLPSGTTNIGRLTLNGRIDTNASSGTLVLNTNQGANTIGGTGILGTAGQPGTLTTLATITAQLSTNTGAVVNMAISNFRTGGESRFNGTTFNAPVTIEDFGGFGNWRGLRVNSCTFNGTVNMTNSISVSGGNGSNFGFSGNTFNADATITCNSTVTGVSLGDASTWFPAAATPREIFNANLTLITSPATDKTITIDGGSTTTTVAGNLTVNCNGGAGEVVIHNIDVAGTSAFNMTNLTSGNGIRVAQDAGRTATFHGDVSISNTGSTINELFRCARLGSVTFNGNITVSSTGGTSGARRIHIGDDETQAGTIALAANRAITVNANVGTINIQKTTQTSGVNTHTHSFTIANTADINMINVVLFGNAFFTATNLTGGNGIRVAQDAGQTATFHGDVSISNTGSTINELFRCARLGNVTFNGNITVSSTGGASGARRIRIGDDETQAGTIALAANRTITATGVQVGELHINKITQTSGINTHTHNLSTAAAVQIFVNRNTLHGNLIAAGDRMQFRRNTIGSSSANAHTISHIGTTNSNQNGGNTFKGALTMTLTRTMASGAPSAWWIWGWNDGNNNGGPDVFENDVTVNVNADGVANSLNNGTANGGLIAFADNTTGNAFNTLGGQTIFNLNNNVSAIHLARNANTEATIHGNFTAIAAATNNGNLTWDATTRGALQIAFNSGSVVTFKNDVVLNNQSTTDLSCCGRNQFSLAASGTIHFEGNVTFNGSGTAAYNFANATSATPSARGLLIFKAGNAQTISGNIANLDLVRVKIDKSANDVTLANNSFRISNELILTTRNLVLGNNNLLLHSAAATPVNATITGGSASSYVVAVGTGRLFRRVGATNVVFPVGTASAYMPFTINNAGTADQFGVRMADLSAAPYSINSYFVNHGWDVIENAAGGSNSTITAQWNATNEQSSFNRAQSAFYRWSGSQFNCLQPEAAASGGGPYTRSVATLGATNSLGVFAVATAFADADVSATNIVTTSSCGGINLNANVNPFTGPGQWSQVSGPTTVTFANTSSPTSLVSGMITGTYVLRWTTAQGCTNRTSDVTIHFTQTSLVPVTNCVWTGNANNGSWTDCSNWSGSVPGEVTPGVFSNVTIPGGLTTMYPVLSANVTVNNFTMTAGASINLANFTLEARGATAIAGSAITANGGVFNKASVSDDNWDGGNTFNGSLTIRHSGAGGTLTLASTSGNTFNSTATVGIANHTYTFDIAHASANIVLGTNAVTSTFIGNAVFKSLRNADFQAGNLSFTTNIHSTISSTDLQSGKRLVMNNYTINRGGTFTLTFYGLHTVNNTMTLTTGRTLLADNSNLLLNNSNPSAIIGVAGPTHDEREIAPGDINNQSASFAGTGTFSWLCAPNATPYVFPTGFGGWNPNNTRWGRMSAFTFVLQGGTDIITVQSIGNITPAATYSLTNARTGSINNEHINLQWIVTCANAASNLQFSDITLPWRQYGPFDNFEQASFTPARNRSGIVRFNHSLNKWECIMPVGTPTTFTANQYRHTATAVLSKTSPNNLGVFSVGSVTSDVSLTATAQTNDCRTITLNASNMMSSPATGQWVFVSGPSTPVILNPTNPITQAIGATVDGSYVFEWRRFSAECGGTLAAPIHAAQVTVVATGSGNAIAGATTTWTGNISSDWNNCANWTSGVPDVITNVTIPSPAPHWPTLPGNVTINRIVTNAGAQINLQNFTLTTTNRSDPANPATIDVAFRNIFQNTTIISTSAVANFHLETNNAARIVGPLSQFRSSTFTGDINLVMTDNHTNVVQNGGNTFNERARISNISRGEWRWGVAFEGGKDVFTKDTWIKVKDDFSGARQNLLNTYWNGYNTSFSPVWTGGTLPDPVDYIGLPYYVPNSGQPYTGTKVGFPDYPRNDALPTNDPDPAVNAANFASNESATSANLADEIQSEENIAQATQNARSAANRAFAAIGMLTSEINTIGNIFSNSPVPAAATPCSNAAAITAAQNALNTAIADATAFRDGALQTAANNANAAANDTNLATSTPGQDHAAANAANSAANTAQTHRANMWTALTNYLAAVNTCITNYNSAVNASNNAKLATGYINMAYNTTDNEFQQNTYVIAENNGRIHFAFEPGSSVRFGGATVNPSLVTELRSNSSGGFWGAINVARRGTAIFNTRALVRQAGNQNDENAAIRIYRENNAPGAVSFNSDLTISQPGEGLVFFGEANNGVPGGIVLNGDLILDNNLTDATVDNIHQGGLFFNHFTKNSPSDFTIISDNKGRLQMEMTNVFNGNALLENRSVDLGQRIGYDNVASVQTFNGNLTLRNAAVSSIQVSGRGQVNFNGNLMVENTLDFLSVTNDPNRCGVCIGQHWDAAAAGVSTLANGKQITVGPAGYASGTLLLQRFTQLGVGTPQTIALSAPQSEINVFGSTFQSSVTLEAPELRVRNSIFQPTAPDGSAFTHLIALNRGENTGGNTFHEPTTFELRGVRSATLNPLWVVGENDKDDFLDEVTFKNVGVASHFHIANRNAGHSFARKVTFINGTTSAISTDVSGERNRMRIAQEEGATVTFHGDVVVENRQSTEGDIAFARLGDIVIHGNLSLSNINGSLLFGAGNRNNPTDVTDNGQTTLNGTLTLQSGWQKGTLILRGFTANHTAPITLELPSTPDNTLVIGKNGGGRSLFKATAFTAKARVLLLNGATYEGSDLLFEKTGAGANESLGDNDFRGVARFVNHSASDFVMARNERDLFGNNVTFEEVGTGRINPAFRGINEFKGHITVISPNDRNFEFSRNINAANPATGMVQIAGAGTQNLINTIANAAREISFRGLEMNQLTASSLLIPNRNFTIRSTAVFRRGKVRLNNHVLTILSHTNPASVAIIGADLDDSYVQTNGTGTVRRTVEANGASSVTVIFPVGNTTSYLALGLRQSGAAAVTDVYNVRVRDGVHLSYDAANNPTGAAINRMFVNGAWIVTENTNGGTNAQAFLYWKPDDELPNFNRTQSAIVRYNRVTNKWRCTQPAGNINGSTPTPLFWRISGGTATEINDVGVFSVTSLVAQATTPITTCGTGSVTLNAVPFSDPAANAYSPFEGEWTFVSASDGSSITIPPSEKNKWNATIPGLQSGVTYQFRWSNTGLEGECNPGPNVVVTVIVDPSNPIPGVVVRWTGNAGDNDWFNCRNWDRFFIPNHTHDVEIRNVSVAIPAPGLSLTDPNGLPNYTTNGSNTYPIITNGTAFCRNLIIFAGASVSITTNGELNVQQNLTNNQTFAIQSGGKAIIGLDLNNAHTFTNSGEARIGRSLSHNHTAPLTHTTGDIIFQGATNGTIGGSQPIQLNRVFVEKVGGLASTLTLTQPLTIHTRLQLTSGRMVSSNAAMLLLPVNTVCNDGNPQSFVQGPVRRWVDGNVPFVFPTGRGNRWARISVTDLAGASAGDYFTAQYFTNNPYPNGSANMCNPGPNSLSPKLDHVSFAEHWLLDRNPGGTAQAKVALYWENPAPNASAILLFSNLYAARYNGSCWENRGGNLFGSLAAGRVETPARQSVFSPWTLSSDLDMSLQPLPVELVSLKAELTPDNQGLITWATAWEKNAAYYEVQRSANGKDFEPLGQVQAKGNSNGKQHYQFTDIRPMRGVNYYRLRQVDADGTFTFSPMVDLVVEHDKRQWLEVYPNPTKGSNLKVQLLADQPHSTTLRIYDILGRLVCQQSVQVVKGSNQWTIETVKDFAKGVYLLQVGESQQTVKFVVD